MPSAGGAQAQSSTIYVRNLEERIKPEQLKDSLKHVFAGYGDIIDLVAKRNLKAKGQAFVVLENEEAAAKAIEEVQGFELFDKPMILDFARSKSDATVIRQGTEEDLQAHKRRRLAEKERKQAAASAAEAARLRRPAAGPPDASQLRPAKMVKGGGLKSTNPTATAVIPEEYLPPNKTLFVQNLPEEYGAEELTSIFARFEGFKEIRLVPGRKGIAFVEYDAEAGAISAKESTAGMSLGESERPMKVVYQRA